MFSLCLKGDRKLVVFLIVDSVKLSYDSNGPSRKLLSISPPQQVHEALSFRNGFTNLILEFKSNLSV